MFSLAPLQNHLALWYFLQYVYLCMYVCVFLVHLNLGDMKSIHSYKYSIVATNNCIVATQFSKKN
jgi:hypothetical protein